MILILTGPSRSHKTTTLKRWSEGRHDCGGILSPDIDGLRKLYNIRDKVMVDWQRKDPLPGDIIIGKFSFDQVGFVTGTGWLNDHVQDPDIKYIILDEAGPLELQGKGWDTWLRSSLPLPEDKTFIMVVRRSLVDEVINRYQLEEVKVVDRDYFMENEGEG